MARSLNRFGHNLPQNSLAFSLYVPLICRFHEIYSQSNLRTTPLFNFHGTILPPRFHQLRSFFCPLLGFMSL